MPSQGLQIPSLCEGPGLSQEGGAPTPWGQGSDNEMALTDRMRFIGALETLGTGMRG